MLDPTIFRRYDVRGVAGTQLTAAVAEGVGRALGTRIVRAGGREAAIGRDVRLSSPELAAAAARGLAACGLRVLDLGEVPTPIVYHALCTRGLGGGLIVTGSHNPPGDNGLKLCLGSLPLWGDGVASLRTQIEAQDFESGEGEVVSDAHRATYIEELVQRFRFEPGLKIAVDCGNGVTGPLVMEVAERLGIEVTPLYVEPDGTFPNHVPDPEVPEYMAELGRQVVAGGLACGLGFDGDGDRVGVLDESGHKVSADRLLAVFAEKVLKEHPGGKVRYDVKCSDILGEAITEAGGVPVMGETGHSLLKRDIAELDAVIGGELSGHIVFNRDGAPIDDGLGCGLRFLELLQGRGGPASALFAHLPRRIATAEIKLPCADLEKFAVVEGLVEEFSHGHDVIAIDGARVVLPGAWFLVRASNTTPNLTVRLEAEDSEGFERARAMLVEALRDRPAVDAQPLVEAEAAEGLES